MTSEPGLAMDSKAQPSPLDDLPGDALPAPRAWEREASANLTGSPGAYRPAGALERGGHRAAATGDYEAWRPGAE